MTVAPTEKNWIFVSDAHLTGRDPEEMDLFLGFLESETERMGYLVILGDLFEFLFGFKNDLSKRKPSAFADYSPVLNKLQTLYHKGIRVKYFEGNHDFFLQSFFPEQFGIDVDVYPDGHRESLGGMDTYIAHGDLSNPGQWTYRIFRRVLKNSWTYRLIDLTGPKLSRHVAKRLSNRSYQRYHHDVSSNPHPAFKAFARQKFLEGFKIVILGHSHFPEEMEEWIHGVKCLYFNVGDWMTHRSFLRFTPPEQFQLCRFEGKRCSK